MGRTKPAHGCQRTSNQTITKTRDSHNAAHASTSKPPHTHTHARTPRHKHSPTSAKAHQLGSCCVVAPVGKGLRKKRPLCDRSSIPLTLLVILDQVPPRVRIFTAALPIQQIQRQVHVAALPEEKQPSTTQKGCNGKQLSAPPTPRSTLPSCTLLHSASTSHTAHRITTARLRTVKGYECLSKEH